MSVEQEARGLAAALARAFEHDTTALGRTDDATVRAQAHVVQVCPLCEARLGLWVDNAIGPSQFRRQLFVLYDAHRCVSSTDPHTMFERAERALLTAAERIDQLADPELRARAELEADRMAEIAARLRAAF